MLKKVAKVIFHKATGNRKFYYSQVEKLAKTMEKKTVLELGSGKQVKGKETYSTKHLFPSSTIFIQSDIDPTYGHKIVDATKMTETNKYDLVLCLNVLEHIFEYQKAVDNIHRSLKKKGTLCIAVPFVFPLHDEPHDYWRFTEHALRKILKDFSRLEIKPQRSKKFPTGYFLIATK